MPKLKPTESIAIKKTGLRWLESAPITWDAAVSAMKGASVQELQTWLDAMAAKAALLSGYLDNRGAIGCGDNGHTAAVESANRKLVKVRKALGYTYPEKGQVRF